MGSILKSLIVFALFGCAIVTPPMQLDGVIVSTTGQLIQAVEAGGVIYVREGMYTPVNFTVGNDTSLLAYPGEAPVIMGSGYRVLHVVGSNVVIDGLTVDGSNADAEVIKVTYRAGQPRPDNVTLSNLIIVNGQAHGILVTHAERVTIRDSHISNTGLGLFSYESHGIYISDTGRAVIAGNNVHTKGLSVHVYGGLPEQVTFIDGNDLDAIGCYYGSCVIQNNYVGLIGIAYDVISARIYHNTLLGEAGNKIVINVLRRDLFLEIANNFLQGGTAKWSVTVYGRNPYNKMITASLHHNIFTPATTADYDFSFPVDIHDNINGDLSTVGYGEWVVPLDYFGNLRGDPPRIGAAE